MHIYTFILILIISIIVFIITTYFKNYTLYADKNNDSNLRKRLAVLSTPSSFHKKYVSSQSKTGTKAGVKIGTKSGNSNTKLNVHPHPHPIVPQSAPLVIRRGQLKPQKSLPVKNIVFSYLQKNENAMKNNLNTYLKHNSPFTATQLTVCNTNNPTLDDIICNLKFQYKVQSLI